MRKRKPTCEECCNHPCVCPEDEICSKCENPNCNGDCTKAKPMTVRKTKVTYYENPSEDPSEFKDLRCAIWFVNKVGGIQRARFLLKAISAASGVIRKAKK